MMDNRKKEVKSIRLILIALMGHGFGLAEDHSNQYSIMYYSANGIQVNTVQECDNNAILYLYGD